MDDGRSFVCQFLIIREYTNTSLLRLLTYEKKEKEEEEERIKIKFQNDIE
jgi:hypothetical protein